MEINNDVITVLSGDLRERCKDAIDKIAAIATLGGDITSMKKHLLSANEHYVRSLIIAIDTLSVTNHTYDVVDVSSEAFTVLVEVSDFKSDAHISTLKEYFDNLDRIANAILS